MIHPLIFTDVFDAQLFDTDRRALTPFFKSGDARSLIQRAALRVSGPGFSAPVVVTREEYRSSAERQLEEVGVEAADWVINPVGGLTEVALKAARLYADNPDALLLILPCGHQIEDEVAFLRSLASATEAARQGAFVTFGVSSERLVSGCGCLSVSESGSGALQVVDVVEETSGEWVEQIADGRGWLWNTGIALVRAERVLRVLQDAVQELSEGVSIEQALLARGDAFLAFELDCGWSPSVTAMEPNGTVVEDAAPQEHLSGRCHDSWGYFETLSSGPRFQVKRIMVEPGAMLPLQSHVHRAEHWVVVSGSALVTVGGDVRLLTENESIYIPLGVVHRLENPGKLPLHLIKVQSGCYLGEDDVIHHEEVSDCVEVA